MISQSTEVRVKDKANLETAGEISDIKNIPGTFSLFSVLESTQLPLTPG